MLNIFIFIIIIILIAIILFIKKSKKIEEKKLNKIKNIPIKHKKSLDFNNIKIPSIIKDSNIPNIIKSTTDLYKIFKSLNYISKDNNELSTTIEWNNFEVSQFLYLLQLNKNILMQDSKDIFHSFILSLNKEEIENELKNIIYKYNKSITKDHMQFLKNQVIWSAKEISVILYYLSSLKDVK